MDDVIVVGAGPGGNLVAYLLARQEYKVSVIEKRENIGDKLCTGIVSAECFSRFPADESVVLRKVSSASFVSPKGIQVKLAVDQPQAYILDRVAYVASFARRAQEVGATYIEAKVLGVEVGPHSVEVCLEGEERREVRRAKAVVISPGFGSRLTQEIGLGTVRDFGIGAQVMVNAPEVEEVRVYFGQRIAPNFFAWLVPTVGNQRKWDTLRPERLEIGRGLGELPEGLVVASSPF